MPERSQSLLPWHPCEILPRGSDPPPHSQYTRSVRRVTATCCHQMCIRDRYDLSHLFFFLSDVLISEIYRFLCSIYVTPVSLRPAGTSREAAPSREASSHFRGCRSAPAPVSYTHLDVYKRQSSSSYPSMRDRITIQLRMVS